MKRKLKRDYVIEFLPPKMVDVAERRSRGMLRNFGLVNYDLQRLLTSVYLQGCTDMGEVALRSPYRLPLDLETQEKGSGM